MDDKTKALDIAMSLIDCKLPTLEKCRISAIQMAEWKDQQMIKKAYEWLNNNAGGYLDYEAVKYGESVELDKESLLEDFKQAMNEQ